MSATISAPGAPLHGATAARCFFAKFAARSSLLQCRHGRRRTAVGRVVVGGALVLSAISVPVTAWPQARPQALTPVVVTAARFAEPAADLPFGVSVINAAQIQDAGVTTVNEAVMKLLGVPGRQDFYGGGDYALDLRGFGATSDNNQVVVVDGVRISEADLGGTRLAGIPIDDVERIEVIRGSGAVLYGEGATGGVISITTKSGAGTARRNRADLYLGGGSFGLREGRGTGTLVLGNFSLDASANKRNTDNDRQNFRSKTEGASAGAQWRNGWLRIGGRTAWDQLATGLPGGLSSAEYAADRHQTDTPNASAAIRNNRSNLFGDATLGDWRIGLDVGYRTKELGSDSGGFGYAYDIDATTYALRARHDAKWADVGNSFIAGIDHDQWHRRVLGEFRSDANQRSQAYYLRDEVTLPVGTRLSLGGRTEQVVKHDGSAVAAIDRHPNAWEVGVVQPVAGGWSVYGRYGHSFRLANVDEFSFALPDAVLRPQTSRDAELGARWVHAGGRIELRIYRSALTDEIGYDPNAVAPDTVAGFGGANVNFDRTRREGAELELTQALTRRANLRINAATRRARFTAGVYRDKDVPLTPRRTLSVHGDWVPAVGHKLDAGINYVSSQHPDFDNACRMPSYATADARYAYQWRFAEVALGIANLTDKKYYTQAFRCEDGVVGSIYPEAGRAATASVRMQF